MSSNFSLKDKSKRAIKISGKFLLSYYKRETAAKPQKQPGTSLTYV